MGGCQRVMGCDVVLFCRRKVVGCSRGFEGGRTVLLGRLGFGIWDLGAWRYVLARRSGGRVFVHGWMVGWMGCECCLVLVHRG